MIERAKIDLLRHINLLGLIGTDTTLRGGSEKYGPCPFCGGTDRFHVRDNRWFCSHCTGRPDENGWHDTIDYVQYKHGLPFEPACALLANEANDCDLSQLPERRFGATEVYSSMQDAPSPDWQAKAYTAIRDNLCDELFKPKGDAARAWLQGRGIDEAAMVRYNLGYTKGGSVEGIEFKFGRGIVIPHWYQPTGTMFALKVRRAIPDGSPNKYYCATGSRPSGSLYNADSLIGSEVCFVTEGEFDAIALHSRIRDLAAVITLGSKTAKLSDRWRPHLFPVKRFYITTDANEDEKAAHYWLALVGERGKRVLPPGRCKDVCESAAKGYDLRAWAMKVMADG